jgi:hypothetical protein
MTRNFILIHAISILGGFALSAEPNLKLPIDAIRQHIGSNKKKSVEMENVLLSSTLAQLHSLDEKGRVELWLAVRAYFEKQIDPKFDPKDLPSLNLAPKNGLSGVSPESVTDPVAREEYIQALARNRNKAEYYRLQTQLVRSLSQLDSHAALFFGAFDSNPTIRTERAIELLKKHGVPAGVIHAVAKVKTPDK